MKDNRATKGFSLKDQLFNRDKVRYLASLFGTGIDAELFESQVMNLLPALELKARMLMIAKVLAAHLPQDFPSAAKQIQAALPSALDPNKADDDFGDFILSPLAVYVSNNGLNHLDISLALLREMTMRFSVEFDIRFFINAHPVATMAALKNWASDDNYHVRRLVSEGTRPALPWAGKIDLTIHEPLEMLDILHSDNTRYVTRSVANHLNDIAKQDPDLVVETLIRWIELGKQNKAEMDWITRHALRTLIKQGHRGALELLGYGNAPEIVVSALKFSPETLKIGAVASISFSVSAARDENLMIDYVIDFLKKNGNYRPKVFKLKKISIKSGEMIDIGKNHRFLKDASTFTHYPGRHRIWLQINGEKHGLCEFDLT